jgi:ribosomal small subunit protein bTHX
LVVHVCTGVLKIKIQVMGKGDLKSRRGKLVNGSYGVRRRRKSNKPPIESVVADKKVEKAPVKKAKPASAAVKKPKEAPKATPKEASEVARMAVPQEEQKEAPKAAPKSAPKAVATKSPKAAKAASKEE